MSLALDALTAVRPALVSVNTAHEVLGLHKHELLHAGPPLNHPRQPPAALRSSIVMTCLHEGWARDEKEAEELLRDGELTLSPAQARDCVTPLAAVVGPSTPLFGVRDSTGGPILHAPVSAVRGSDTRMGTRGADLLARLRTRDEEIAPAWQTLLREHGPLDLWACAVYGLNHGDDLHSRTTSANEALATAVRQRGDTTLADAVCATPLFFLTLWMAAAACMLRAAEGGDVPTLVTRAGGNGERFGIALAGDPARWISHDATPPQGPYAPNAPDGALPVGAIGDSAVIDLLGLGGQRLAYAPEPHSLVATHLPEDHGVRARHLMLAPHPALPGHWPVGIDVRRVVQQAYPPAVMLAMVAADGASGFLGRGVYRPPLTLFEQAA